MTIFRLKYLLIFITFAAFCTGCRSLVTPGIQPGSLTLPGGSRILIAEAVGRNLGYEIVAPRKPVSLPGLTVVTPSENHAPVRAISSLIPAIILESGADMVFILVPQTAIEHRYDPYPVLKGWYRSTSREDNIYPTREEPVYESRYKFTCTRTNYQVFQYDDQAQLKGAALVKPVDSTRCPETAQTDIHLDEYDAAVSWLQNNVRPISP